MLKSGDVVDIYLDPLTRRNLEGSAKVIRVLRVAPAYVEVGKRYLKYVLEVKFVCDHFPVLTRVYFERV